MTVMARQGTMPIVRHALLTAALLTVLPTPAPAQEAAAPATEIQPQAERPSNWGWVLLLAGAATVAASATFALRARSDHEDWAATHNPERKALLKERGTSRSLAADITGAAGILTVASGAFLLWTF